MQQVSAMEFFAVCLVHGDYVLISSKYLNLNNSLLCFQSKHQISVTSSGTSGPLLVNVTPSDL